MNILVALESSDALSPCSKASCTLCTLRLLILAAPCRKAHLFESKLSGFVLITLLILLMILSLLVLSTTNSSLLQTKMAHNFFMGFQQMHDADRVLQRAEATIARYSSWSCYLDVAAADHVLKIKNTTGLSSLNSCRVVLAEERTGRYIIQPIPDEISDVCLDGENKDTVSYYRVTGWVEFSPKSNDKNRGEGVLLQTTYAKLRGQRVQKKCMQFPKITESARLSWRLLS